MRQCIARDLLTLTHLSEGIRVEFYISTFKVLCYLKHNLQGENFRVTQRDHGKITNKSITETEGSLIYTFNNSPTKVEEMCYVSKDIYSKEHSYTLKLGRDSGTCKQE
ncbi:uncharacterized protein LOC111168314 [Delphinapterus leucas]|uniref:Uncharacterized protein LOC111168314 n=1 Tax=Delphinapterus leucas TaxID=9749 RepID=A0A2Y9M9F5_DELLE|nr:uncharacterized protein LOC111168314 [Delphinapterus leucas]